MFDRTRSVRPPGFKATVDAAAYPGEHLKQGLLVAKLSGNQSQDGDVLRVRWQHLAGMLRSFLFSSAPPSGVLPAFWYSLHRCQRLEGTVRLHTPAIAMTVSSRCRSAWLLKPRRSTCCATAFGQRVQQPPLSRQAMGLLSCLSSHGTASTAALSSCGHLSVVTVSG